MSREITVINDSSFTGWVAAATRIGEVYMSDVNSMVDNVRAELGNDLMHRLNILDHGNSMGLMIGSDWLTPVSIGFYEPKLYQLRPCFSLNGFVHLQHCLIGSNYTLLRRLAEVFGVPVIGGTGYQNPVYRFNTGHYDRCNPTGACQANVGRP